MLYSTQRLFVADSTTNGVGVAGSIGMAVTHRSVDTRATDTDGGL